MKTIITKNTYTKEIYAMAFITDNNNKNKLVSYTYKDNSIIYTATTDEDITCIDASYKDNTISQVIITDNDIEIINNLEYIQTSLYNFEPLATMINNSLFIDESKFIIYPDMLRT